ncbi:uncharacterized protein L201_000699 [Kwoniella dendrophila CBS 6074]|uniref:tRNA (guanine(10)-N(2))-methyltransferase n=1 Tax=Kwoniella dendrophila CBS 6074 TaxID=1295534 RepID=A0AAX4JK99_9TREE
MPQYILRISHEHLTFRIPSLLSISQVFKFPIKIISQNKYRGLLIVELEKEEHVHSILDRHTLVLSASELLAEGSSYDDLHNDLRQHLEILDPYKQASFKFTLEGSGHRVVEARITDIVESFDYTALEGPIRMKNPEVEFVVFEDYELEVANTTEARFARDGKFTRVYFGRRIGMGKARLLAASHEVKHRAYYGNTSMEAHMAFLMAGQTLPAPGKIIYDPFVGTGSMLYASAHWGAYVFGSDIDGRQIKGKMKEKEGKPGIFRAAEQYGLSDLLLDCLTYDVTKSPMRRGGWIDAIITDPPYGVRAGAKRQGRKEGAKKALKTEPVLMPDGRYSHEMPGYQPPSRPYELANLTLDLVQLARYLLVPGGRLVFFLPTVTEDYQEIDVPVVEGMRELKVDQGSVQDFGKWGRRLITMEKTAQDDGVPPKFEDHEEFDINNQPEHLPGHHGFRERYATGFRSRSKSGNPSPSTTTPASPPTLEPVVTVDSTNKV